MDVFEQAHYDSMVKHAGPLKPIALAEVAAMPTLAVFAAQPRWSYVMMWSGLAEGANTPNQLQTIFHAPNVINRSDVRLPRFVVPSVESHSSPIHPQATNGVRDLLNMLSKTRFVSTASPGASANPVFAEFQLEGRSAGAAGNELKQLRKSGKAPLLRWTPLSPAGDGQYPLDDFEWSELMKPGTTLNKAWAKEIDRLVSQLKELHEQESSLVPPPLPQSNSSSYWWGQRPGPDGSERPVEDLYAALQKADVHTLLLAWEPALVPPAVNQVRRSP